MRFPEFEGEWVENEVQDILKIGNGRDYRHLQDGNIPVFGTGGYMTSVNEYLYNGESVCIGRKGTINKPFLLTGKFWTVDTLFYTHSYKGVSPRFVFYTFEQINWLKYNEASGVPSLPKSVIEKIPFSYPSKKEQSKIATFLTLIDQRIETQRKIIEDLELLKSAIRDKIFEDIQKTSAVEYQIKDILDYEQPTEYIVGDTQYIENTSETPVLTANKSFILGYTSEKYGIYDKGDCIIFDDFTMDMKYVVFPFKVKSSAIKILSAKKDFNLLYIYEYLQSIKLQSGEHKRHYISEVQALNIPLVDFNQQYRISNVLQSFDKKLNIELSIYNLLEKQKKYLLNEMFI